MRVHAPLIGVAAKAEARGLRWLFNAVIDPQTALVAASGVKRSAVICVDCALFAPHDHVSLTRPRIGVAQTIALGLGITGFSDRGLRRSLPAIVITGLRGRFRRHRVRRGLASRL